MQDNRLLRIGIEINGRLQVYEGLKKGITNGKERWNRDFY